MQLERFDHFVTEVANDGLISNGAESFAIYRFFNGKWYDQQNEVMLDSSLLKDLNTTRRRRIDWRHKGGLYSYFNIKQLDSVVTVQFAKPANMRTRLRYAGYFDRCLRNSKNAFDATHDSLTGLLNRGGFESKLLALSKPMSAEGEGIKGTPSTLQAVAILGLLAFDIDHFKQINDSYGHQYGDIVLQCFSRRLMKKAESVMAASLGKLRVTVARPGGEEFAVIVEGAASVEQLIGLAEQFRFSICESALPTDEELAALAEEYEGAIPPSAERRITTSVGVANVNLNISDEIQRQWVSRLIHRADTALYRAKVGGRNLVRNFSDIIAQYGRVLEHHQDTAVVTIDIGSLVGVALGQEFLVYHPDFSGGVPFLFRDGRTQKRLGDYPRVPCGRIVVFNVQPEISFCKVAQRDCPSNFASGALLEEIPMGSLSHLLAFETQFTAAAPDLVSAEKLPEAVNAIIQSKSKPFVAVICIKNLGEVSAKRGQVFINQCIIKMYQVIREKFGFHAGIGQVQTSSLAVVLRGEKNSSPNIKKVEDVISSLNDALKGQATFIAGIFDPNLDDKSGSDFDFTFALEFALFAAYDEERSTVNGIQCFNGRVASAAVYESRRIRAYGTALADYRRFVEHGIKNANLENNAALCEAEKPEPDYDAALAAINRAIALNGKDPTFFANKGYIEYFRGDLNSTLKNYRQCWEVDEKYKLADVYLPSYALSLAHLIRAEAVSDDIVLNAIAEIDNALKHATKINWVRFLAELRSEKQRIVTDPRFSRLFVTTIT